ncbi:hypothetical protein NX059_008523 [Plenodomus lindquistii]|nr:hypothetical protein NX059_008523 [Plenodomus lindquistii]
MNVTTKRPRTPSPTRYPLTPPSTGGSGKRVRFNDAESIIGNSTSRRGNKTREGESPDAFFKEVEEGSDVELSDINEGDSTSSSDDTATTSASSDSTATSIASERSLLDKQDHFAALALALDAPTTATKPFQFMRLPLTIRNRVYEHLLVVPAIICVRQNHTAYHDAKRAFLYAERRELLPGIAYALAQISVDGFKVQFSRFSTSNISILRASSQVHAEAKVILYSKNDFEIIKPTTELAPPPDYSVRLFPSGCQRHVTKLNIRIHSFYDLHWLLTGGYNVIKNYYRGLTTLTLILEKQSTTKGFGKKWARKEGEKWATYVKRLQDDLAHDLFGNQKSKMTKVIPTWINLRVLFSGEAYSEATHAIVGGLTEERLAEHLRRNDVKHALVEAWELFKKGGSK